MTSLLYWNRISVPIFYYSIRVSVSRCKATKVLHSLRQIHTTIFILQYTVLGISVNRVSDHSSTSTTEQTITSSSHEILFDTAPSKTPLIATTPFVLAFTHSTLSSYKTPVATCRDYTMIPLLSSWTQSPGYVFLLSHPSGTRWSMLLLYRPSATDKWIYLE